MNYPFRKKHKVIVQTSKIFFNRPLSWVIALIIMGFTMSMAQAKVVRIVVTSRDTIQDGHTFGKYGAYEKITGRVYFAFDPANAANKKITDIGLAPVNRNGDVEAWANFIVYQPVDPAKRSGISLVEVPNRGRGGNFYPLFARHGFTMVWIGWEFDVPPEPASHLRLHVPYARNPDGSSIHGLVRSDWVIEARTKTLRLGHGRSTAKLVGYPVSDTTSQQAYLTVRDGRDTHRRLVTRSAWKFARYTKNGKIIADRRHIYMESGFTPGKIYELVYPSKNPPVVGLGLAVVRDIISYQKYDPKSLFPAKRGIATGISQDGRFLRHFLYQGFNIDEAGRKAYDGILDMAAGAGRGSFNHRFAQPSRDGLRFSAFFYPTDIFPFTGRKERDPMTGQSDGLLTHMPKKYLPKIFYEESGYEYWSRDASLIHTSVNGTRDISPLPNVRIYHIAGTQHILGNIFPPTKDTIPDPGAPPGRITGPNQPAAWRGDPVFGWYNMRALTLRLVDWIVKDWQPPPSAIPHIADGTLVPVKEAGKAFPKIPGVGFPKVTQIAYRADYGPRWKEGIIDYQPPRLGPAFKTLVPITDSLGNELGGIRNVELRVPLATYTPWSLRMGMPGPQGELVNFRGTFIPLPWNKAEKKQTGDPRPAVSQLYHSRKEYMVKVRAAVDSLIGKGFLIPEDSTQVVKRAGRIWDWMAKRAKAHEKIK